MTRVSHAAYMSSRHFLSDTSPGIIKTSCGYRETPAIRVRRSCTTFQNDLRELLLWIREQQAFKLPLSTPEGGPAVFHCCVEESYLFISQLLFRLEREREKKKLASEGLWQSTGVRGSLSFYIYIYKYIYSLHSQENEMAGKGSRHWRRWSLASRRILLCRFPQLLQVDSLTAFTLAVSFPTKQDDTTKETAFIRLLLVCCANHICTFFIMSVQQNVFECKIMPRLIWTDLQTNAGICSVRFETQLEASSLL